MRARSLQPVELQKMKLSEKRKFLHVMWKDFCELWSPDGDKSGEFTIGDVVKQSHNTTRHGMTEVEPHAHGYDNQSLYSRNHL